MTYVVSIAVSKTVVSDYGWHSAGECGPKVHGIISGLGGLIAGIKNG